MKKKKIFCIDRHYLCFWHGKLNIGCHLFKNGSLHESHNNHVGNYFYINSHYIHFHLLHLFKFLCCFWSLEFFCINVKLLRMIFTSMILTKLVGLSSTLSKLFLFWRWCMSQFLPHVSPMRNILQQQFINE